MCENCGNYKLILGVQDSENGCWGYDTLDVTVSDMPGPNPYLSPKDTLLCQSGTVFFRTENDYDAYKWYSLNPYVPGVSTQIDSSSHDFAINTMEYSEDTFIIPLMEFCI